MSNQDLFYGDISKKLTTIQQQNDELLKQTHIQNCLKFFELTGESEYLNRAQRLMGVKSSKLSDENENSFTK